MDIGYIKKMFSLEGQNVLITGCTSGIGQAFCKACAMAGANIIGTYNSTPCNTTQDMVSKIGSKFFAVKIDLSKIDSQTADEIYTEVEEKVGPVSVLINNAGVNRRNMALDYTIEDWDMVLDVNLKNVFILSQELARRCVKEKRKCKIINVASLLGFQAGYRTAAYTSSKHGIIGLTKLLANEWGQYSININAIAPGYIYTRMTADFIKNNEISDRCLDRIPLQRWGVPDDLSGAVLFLASSASDYVQGATIVVDGGYLNS